VVLLHQKSFEFWSLSWVKQTGSQFLKRANQSPQQFLLEKQTEDKLEPCKQCFLSPQLPKSDFTVDCLAALLQSLSGYAKSTSPSSKLEGKLSLPLLGRRCVRSSNTCCTQKSSKRDIWSALGGSCAYSMTSFEQPQNLPCCLR